MDSLNISEEEQMTKKEYLKEKKKKNNKFKKIRKRNISIIVLVSLLAIYVFFQFYIYYKANNYKFLTDEHVDNQKVYNMYFLSEGYTYEPKTSLKMINTLGLEETEVSIAKNIGFTSIMEENEYIYGLKENGLYKVNKNTSEVTMLVEKDVYKFTIYKSVIYYITKEENTIHSFNVTNNEDKNLEISNVKEVLVDETNLYLCVTDLEKSKLIKYDKEGKNKIDLTKKEKVSYIIENGDKIYFVNKSDDNKIYSVNKDGTDLKKVLDIKSKSDKGDTIYIAGNKYMFVYENFLYYINTEDNDTLWKASLLSDEKEKILYSSLEMLEFYENTIFYKNKNEMGVYLYNLNTKFTAQISPKLIKEFIIERN